MTWAATWILVKPATAGEDLSEPGDSEEPWFRGNRAYGIVRSQAPGDGKDAVYMAINYISDLDLSVLTE